MLHRGCSRSVAVRMFVGLFAWACVLPPDVYAAQPQEDAIEAIWRVQRLEFEYRSLDVHYTCTALREKIAAMLVAVGVHEGVVIEILCGPAEFVNHAHASVTLASPVEATPENLEAATTYDLRAELLARVHKARLPTAADIERFPAVWRSVSMARDRSLGLTPGDCELLRNVREQIFPKLAVRIVKDGPFCPGTSPGRIRPRLVVAALVPEP